MSYKEKIQQIIKEAINGASSIVSVERTKLKEHGDVSTNVAMVLAKDFKKNPFEIANEIKEKLKHYTSLISHIEIAKPGFINLVISDYALSESLVEVLTRGKDYGFSPKNSKEKILIEYVSANPTGDLHIGHGRQAVIGSCLLNLLEAYGHDTFSEFYINDFGEQIQKLNNTVEAIYKKMNGESIEWKEDFYPEETIRLYVEKVMKSIQISNFHPQPSDLGQKVKDEILKTQKELLSSFGVNFNNWYSETTLHKNKKVEEVIEKLKEKGYTYEEGGAIWFKAKDLGDVRDRVLIRKDGRPTYLVADIAYHIEKFKRSEKLITIWGADHHGQEVSLKSALEALGFDKEKLEVVFVQLVSLKKGEQEVKMSKRAGMVVNASDVLNEVGPDAFRFFLVETHPDNRMIFDIELAKKQDKENPVFYIQYAHARCCSIFRQLNEQNKNAPQAINSAEILLNLFKTNNQEYTTTKNLVLKVLDFPEEVNQAAINRSPSRISNYLKELASDFHIFYTTCRVISKDLNLTNTRLALIQACKVTIANGLKILGITAPEAM